MRKHLILTLLALTPAVALTQEEPQSLTATAAQCSGISVSAVPPSTSAGTPAFSARKILDIAFTVRFPADAAESLRGLIHLSVYTPKEHLYQSFVVPVRGGGSGVSGGVTPVPGYPYPLKVAQPSVSVVDGEKQTVVKAASLQVAGTSIVASSLYGVWHVEARMEGSPQSCRAQFRVTQ